MALETSIRPQTTASSETKTVTAAASHSSIFTCLPGVATSAVVTVTTDTYMRMSASDSTAPAADGTDQLLLSGNQYRVEPIPDGHYLHFIRKSADGSVFITPRG